MSTERPELLYGLGYRRVAASTRNLDVEFPVGMILAICLRVFTLYRSNERNL